jgi:endoglucanase
MAKQLSATHRTKAGAVTLLVAFSLVLNLLAGCASAQTGDTASPKARLAFARAEKLKRGINTSGWFAQVYDQRGYTAEHFQVWTSADDIALIKSMGFDHVRLSVNPQPMFNEREPNSIPADYLGNLDAAVKMILDHG